MACRHWGLAEEGNTQVGCVCESVNVLREEDECEKEMNKKGGWREREAERKGQRERERESEREMITVL